jgi:hypothetical protein
MAFGTDHVILADVANFVPELWSDEVVAAYKANLVYGNLVRKLNHRGKKGDTIKVPILTSRDHGIGLTGDVVIGFR